MAQSSHSSCEIVLFYIKLKSITAEFPPAAPASTLPRHLSYTPVHLSSLAPPPLPRSPPARLPLLLPIPLAELLLALGPTMRSLNSSSCWIPSLQAGNVVSDQHSNPSFKMVDSLLLPVNADHLAPNTTPGIELICSRILSNYGQVDEKK